MATKKRSARSSKAKSRDTSFAKDAQGADGVLRSNDVVAKQASAIDDLVNAFPFSVHHASLVSLHGALTNAGAVVHFVGPRVGMFVGDSGGKIEADKSMENSPGFLFDALVVLDGSKAVEALAGNRHTKEFIGNLFAHGKAILALGAGRKLLELAGIGPSIDDDPGLLEAASADAAGIAPAFVDAIAAHRHPSREGEPRTK